MYELTTRCPRLYRRLPVAHILFTFMPYVNRFHNSRTQGPICGISLCGQKIRSGRETGEKESSRITVFTAGVKSCPKIELVRTPVIFSLCSYYLYVLLVELL